jgi:NO-binding membrane sensor protein with MHYT domain
MIGGWFWRQRSSAPSAAWPPCCFSRAQAFKADQRAHWVMAAAFASGIGIWATHFIAMLAYDGGLPVSYNPSLTTISVVVAILSSWMAIATAFKGESALSFTAGGLIMALGIAAMHFTGMQAIDAPATLTYDPKGHFLQSSSAACSASSHFSPITGFAARSASSLQLSFSFCRSAPCISYR